MEHAQSEFTGEVKPVLYVADVRRSVDFYRGCLGFEFLFFYDFDNRRSVVTWEQPYPPRYAEMAAAGQKFGLHLPGCDASRSRVGRQRLYFRVRNLAAQHGRVSATGIDVGAIVHTAWMDMFDVKDADGHEIVFASTDSSLHTLDPW